MQANVLDIKIWQTYAPIPNSVIFLVFSAALVFVIKRVLWGTRGLLRSHLLVYCMCLFTLIYARLSIQFVFGEPKPILPQNLDDDDDDNLLPVENVTNTNLEVKYVFSDGKEELQYFVRYSIPVVVYMSKFICVITYGLYLIWRAHHLKNHIKNHIVELPFWNLVICFLVFGILKVDWPAICQVIGFPLTMVFLIAAFAIAWKRREFNDLSSNNKFYLGIFMKESAVTLCQSVLLVLPPVGAGTWKYRAFDETICFYEPFVELALIYGIAFLFTPMDFHSESDSTPTTNAVISNVPQQEGPLSLDGISNRSVDGSIDGRSVCSNEAERQDKMDELGLEPCAHSVSGFESHTEERVERRPLLNQQDRLKESNLSSNNYLHRVECEVNETDERENSAKNEELVKMGTVTQAGPARNSPQSEEHLEEVRCESALPAGCYIEEATEEDIDESADVGRKNSEDSKRSASTESLCSIAGISGLVEETMTTTSTDRKLQQSGELSSESDQELEKIDKPNAHEQDRASLNSFVYYD